jgi:hypothetical protein
MMILGFGAVGISSPAPKSSGPSGYGARSPELRARSDDSLQPPPLSSAFGAGGGPTHSSVKS